MNQHVKKNDTNQIQNIESSPSEVQLGARHVTCMLLTIHCILYAACCMLMLYNCIAVNCLVCTVYCILHCVTVLHHNTYSLARKLVRSVNICCAV